MEFGETQQQNRICAPRRDLDSLVKFLNGSRRILGIDGSLRTVQVRTGLCTVRPLILSGCARHQLRQEEQR